MSVLSALNTAVSGLTAQAEALSNISDNVANSGTVGFKRIDTKFADLVSRINSSTVGAGSVRASARIVADVAGAISVSGSRTHAAISGDGFFAVSSVASNNGAVPTFNTTSSYTRRGDFELSEGGYLVNSSGFYLQGRPLTVGASGVAVETGSQVPIQIDRSPLAARGTTEIVYRANLASTPITSNYRSDTANSELLSAAGFTTSPVSTGAGIVTADENTKFINQSISGGSLDVFGPSGASLPLNLRWGKLTSQASGGSDTWNLWYQSNTAATGTETAWSNAGHTFAFDSSGKITPATNSIAIPNVSLNGSTVGNINLSISNGLTQFADSSGSARVSTVSQDGHGISDLLGVSITSQGSVVGDYSNGTIRPLSSVAVARFAAPNRLERLDGGAYHQTVDSGTPILNSAPALVAGALEASNADIGSEFTKLIVTQQAYAAGARVLTAGNEMLQTVIGVVR